jgi:uncharacterized membrane protein YcjF (UPF0283 family)
MGKQKRTTTDSARDAVGTTRLPIGIVFHISTLIASLSMLIQIAQGTNDLYSILLRTTVVFVGVAIAGSVIMVAIVTAIHRTKQEEVEQLLRLAREEQIASQLSMQQSAVSSHPTPQDLEHSVTQ